MAREVSITQNSFKQVVTVVTRDGKSTAHIYDIPQDTSAIQELAADLARRITFAFSKRFGLLFLDNPSVNYNPTHVIRIESEVFGSDELKQAFENAQRTIGYRSGSKSN